MLRPGGADSIAYRFGRAAVAVFTSRATAKSWFSHPSLRASRYSGCERPFATACAPPFATLRLRPEAQRTGFGLPRPATRPRPEPGRRQAREPPGPRPEPGRRLRMRSLSDFCISPVFTSKGCYRVRRWRGGAAAPLPQETVCSREIALGAGVPRRQRPTRARRPRSQVVPELLRANNCFPVMLAAQLPVGVR